jgi:hypothetical protein
MLIAAGLFLLFLIGLPVSFAIGALLGLLVYRTGKNTRRRGRSFYVICGGVCYIVGQPLSLLTLLFASNGLRKIDTLVGWEIPVEGFTLSEIIYAVGFCLAFTVGVLILIPLQKKPSI